MMLNNVLNQVCTCGFILTDAMFSVMSIGSGGLFFLTNFPPENVESLYIIQYAWCQYWYFVLYQRRIVRWWLEMLVITGLFLGLT